MKITRHKISITEILLLIGSIIFTHNFALAGSPAPSNYRKKARLTIPFVGQILSTDSSNSIVYN